jgi:hypothetical protein
LVVDDHARGWPGRGEGKAEPRAEEMPPADDGPGEPWWPGSRAWCAALITDVRPVRSTKLRAVHFVSRDGRRLKWVSSYNHDKEYLQTFTPGTVGELDGWVTSIETDNDGPIAVIRSDGSSLRPLWNTHPKGWNPTPSIFELQ